MLKGFKQFILRGNVIDLAVGVVIGAAFNSVVNSLVKDLITPFIGALFKTPDFQDLSFTINGSEFMYGNFISSLISFLLVAAAVYFFVVTPINTLVARMRGQAPLDPTTKKCPECMSEISVQASRCPFCTTKIS
jgi:large conductance mechanosensitive channel